VGIAGKMINKGFKSISKTIKDDWKYETFKSRVKGLGSKDMGQKFTVP
jgi:hypothetical protein